MTDWQSGSLLPGKLEAKIGELFGASWEDDWTVCVPNCVNRHPYPPSVIVVLSLDWKSYMSSFLHLKANIEAIEQKR